MRSNRQNQSEKDVSIVLCGQAGTGIQTVEKLLTQTLKLSGFNVFATKEYMSRVRGGMNSTQIRASSEPVRASVDRIDILIPLDKGAVRHVRKRMSGTTVIFAEEEVLGAEFGESDGKWVNVPFGAIAKDIGNEIYSNTVAAGALAGLWGIEIAVLSDCAGRYFKGKDNATIQNNIRAAKKGYEQGKELADSVLAEIGLMADARVKDEVLVNGAEAVALGAITGGCNFVSSYPMSPSTGVLVFLAQHARQFGIVVEQAEDEIAAINMSIGAWYAGARAMVTTSGGGFALMTEGLSLAAMLESPLVVHVAQRPGPATGLPTRTEQGDLELVIYGGHGEFPRIVLAPGTLAEAFHFTARAFSLADKYQVPVFILTDQYFVDSYYNTPAFEPSGMKVEKHVVKTGADYRRYELLEHGVSPRGIPGHGKGLVCVDSDEHDEDGHITEDLDLRIKMVNKRLMKGELMMADAIEPELTGPEDYRHLILAWGSTYNAVVEAVKVLAKDDVALLHIKQVYPLPARIGDYLRTAKNSIMIEGNATGQLCKQIKLTFGLEVDKRILKYNGLSFGVEELVRGIGNLVK